MRAWQDTEAKRHWGAAPSTPLVGDSRAASRIGVFDTVQADDGNRSVNLSGNPKDGRTDRISGKDGRLCEQRWGRDLSFPWSGWIAWRSEPLSVLSQYQWKIV